MDGQAVAESGFFQGYNEWTWLAILIQAVGGLIVAVVVKYTNSIMKGIATSISVILSSVASVFIFNFQIGPQFCLGAAIVLIATYKYVTTVDDMPFEMVPTSELKLNSKETLPN